MTNINDGDIFLSEAKWLPDKSKSVRAQIAKSGEKVPFSIWNENTEGVHKSYYKKDDQGRVVEEIHDTNGDDTLNEHWTIEYNEAGEVRKTSWSHYDDGTPNFVRTIEFDEAGNERKITWDNYVDGKLNNVHTIEYDEARNRVKDTYDDNGDREVDRTIQYD